MNINFSSAIYKCELYLYFTVHYIAAHIRSVFYSCTSRIPALQLSHFLQISNIYLSHFKFQKYIQIEPQKTDLSHEKKRNRKYKRYAD